MTVAAARSRRAIRSARCTSSATRLSRLVRSIEVEINAAGQSDLLAVTGTVTLGGGEVVVLDAPGSYAAGTSYTIVTAGGGVSGAFDGVTDSLPLLDAVLSYLPDSVMLTLERNAQLIAALGITPNQRATGAGIDSLGGGVLETALVSLGASDIPPALDLLSGEIHASVKSAFIEESRYLREAASDRIRSAFGAVGAQAAAGDGLWRGRSDRRRGRHAARHVGRGARRVGLVRRRRQCRRFRPQHRRLLHRHRRAGRRRCAARPDRRLHPQLLRRRRPRFLRLGQLRRISVPMAAPSSAISGFAPSPPIPGTSSTPRARPPSAVSRRTSTPIYDAGTAQVFGEVGYRIDTASASFEPFANVAYVNLHTDGFAETGGAAALDAAVRRYRPDLHDAWRQGCHASSSSATEVNALRHGRLAARLQRRHARGGLQLCRRSTVRDRRHADRPRCAGAGGRAGCAARSRIPASASSIPDRSGTTPRTTAPTPGSQSASEVRAAEVGWFRTSDKPRKEFQPEAGPRQPPRAAL